MKLTHSRAVAVMVLVTLLWSVAGVVTRQLEAARSFEVTFWRSFFTLASLLVILPFSATPRDIGLLALLGLFQLAIPCVLAVLCGGVLKAPEVALLTLLEVIFGILLAWAGAGEVPGSSVLTGGSLVIGALVMNEFIGWRQRA